MNKRQALLSGFPPPPWHLQGTALICGQLIAADAVRPQIPDALKIMLVSPGLTLQACYVARYSDGSTLEYHELIVVAGLVRHRARVGAWVSHIYVDCGPSMDGGRNIWSLPKQLARFNWQDRHDRINVQVEDDTGVRCDLTAARPRHRLTIPLWAPALSLGPDGPLAFCGRGRARASFGTGLLSLWQGCPYSSTDANPRRVLFLDHLRLHVSAPRSL